MSTEAVQYWAKSIKSLNACTANEEIKIVVDKAAPCEAIYIPEVNEIVVLTGPEYVQLADTADAYDFYIHDVVDKNSSKIREDIADARQTLADFLRDETEKALSSQCPKKTGVKPLIINKKNIFIEVIELCSKRSSYVPRVLIESFRGKDKSYELKPVSSGSASAIESTVKTPLRTEDGKINRDDLKDRFAQVKVNMTAKWDLYSVQKTGQLPSKYLVRLFGLSGHLALRSDRFNAWLNNFDLWIKQLNENLNWVYNDRELRKKTLISILDPNETPGDHQSPMLSDVSILSNLQNEVNRLWGASTDNNDIRLLKEINQLKWSGFATDLDALANNCRQWANRIQQWPSLFQQKNDPAGLYVDKHLTGDTSFNARQKLVVNLQDTATKATVEKKNIAEAQSNRKPEEIVFDEESLGRVKNEIEYIWGSSDDKSDKTLVKDVKAIRWNLFAKTDQDLINNRKTYTDRIKKQPLPEYIFDASAQAQFMRYAYGATGSAIYDPLTGKMGLHGEAKADIALVEGAANAKWLLPNNEGVNLKIPSSNKVDKIIWDSLDSGVPDADTFEFDESFLLPNIIKTLSIITQQWSIYNNTPTDHKIQVIGHTDSPGTNSYNDNLSKIRAQVAFELLTYNYNSWFKRFESSQWGEKEIKIMLGCIINVPAQQGRLSDKEWKSRISQFQGLVYKNLIQTPHFADADQGCEIKNIAYIDSNRGVIYRFNQDGRIGTNNLSEKETLKYLIQAYMQKGTGNRFLLEKSFYTPQYIGKGESELAVHTGEHVREEKNRRVEIHLLEAKIDGTDKKVIHIPIGHMRIQIEAYLKGYAGANCMIAADIGYGGSKGNMEAKGLQKGDAEKVGVEDTSNYSRKSTNSGVIKSYESNKKEKLKVDTGVTVMAGAFAGAEATAGIKGILEWKCPRPEPEFLQPNKLIPTQVCAADQKQAPKVIELAGFKDGFAELGSAGYAVTGSIGIGLEGGVQIGFDTTTGKFLVKCQAKLVVGKGGGGAFEFSISTKNVYWFIRFVHAQLNDHDFNFVDFMEDEVYDIFCAWTWELLKQGNILAAGIPVMGILAIDALSEWKDLLDRWDDAIETEETADKLAEQINNEDNLLSYMTPEIKGRLLNTLCQENPINLFDTEENKENAIIKVLSSVSSRNEFEEILEHMGPVLSIVQEERKIEKSIRLGYYGNRKEMEHKIEQGDLDKKYLKQYPSEEQLLNLLDNGVFRGDQLTQYKEWKKNLPDQAPKLVS